MKDKRIELFSQQFAAFDFSTQFGAGQRTSSGEGAGGFLAGRGKVGGGDTLFWCQFWCQLVWLVEAESDRTGQWQVIPKGRHHWRLAGAGSAGHLNTTRR